MEIKIEINEDEGKLVSAFGSKIALGLGTTVQNTIRLSCENRKAIPIGIRELVIDQLELHLCFFYAFLYCFKCRSDAFIHILLNILTHFEFNST